MRAYEANPMPGSVIAATGVAAGAASAGSTASAGSEGGGSPSGRILVVDDEENNRDMLSRRLERKGFSVAVAEDGQRALERLEGREGREGEPFDLVLLDIMMPGLCGLEVLQRVRQRYAPTQLPVIMATAKGEREDIVEALNLGANDYVIKPLDFPVVLARVQSQLAHKRTMDRIVALEQDLQARNAELEQVNARMRKELAMAAQVQQALLPRTPLRAGAAHFEWSFVPCQELAGDILNVFAIDREHVGFYLLDVSGHGVPSALLSVTLSRLLTPLGDACSLVQRQVDGVLKAASPLAVVQELNRRFQMDGTNQQYFTMFYGVLNLRTLLLKYVNAGHQPPAYLGADGSRRLIEHYGLAVGWMPEGDFAEGTLQLQPGDRLFIYSDGITEAAEMQGELFGHGRLLECLCLNRGCKLEGNLQGLISAVSQFRGGQPFEDDISAIALEIGQSAPQPGSDGAWVGLHV